MDELDQVYASYNTLKDAGVDAAKHEDAYNVIIAASQGSDSAKQLCSQFIAKFFTYFPELHLRAIDAVFDLCEEESTVVRQGAIKALPALCSNTPQHVAKIADVLCQLLQSDDLDLPVVHQGLLAVLTRAPKEGLMVVFNQGLKVDEVRSHTIAFLMDQLMPQKDKIFVDPSTEVYFVNELKAAMATANNVELGQLFKIIKGTDLYLKGHESNSLLEILIARVTSTSPFTPNDQESVKRVLLAGTLGTPLLKHKASAKPFLEFLNNTVLPVGSYHSIHERQKQSILKLYADVIAFSQVEPPVLDASASRLMDLLQQEVPLNAGATAQISHTRVECITHTLYHISTMTPLAIPDNLVLHFTALFAITQNQLSESKNAMAVLQAETPKDETKIKALQRLNLSCSNMYAVAREFRKPVALRSSKLSLYPSWKPVPEPTADSPASQKPETKTATSANKMPTVPATTRVIKKATAPTKAGAGKQLDTAEKVNGNNKAGTNNNYTNSAGKRKIEPESNEPNTKKARANDAVKSQAKAGPDSNSNTAGDIDNENNTAGRIQFMGTAKQQAMQQQQQERRQQDLLRIQQEKQRQLKPESSKEIQRPANSANQRPANSADQRLANSAKLNQRLGPRTPSGLVTSRLGPAKSKPLKLSRKETSFAQGLASIAGANGGSINGGISTGRHLHSHGHHHNHGHGHRNDQNSPRGRNSNNSGKIFFLSQK